MFFGFICHGTKPIFKINLISDIMKKTFCTISLALFIASHALFSQTEQGKYLLGISSRLGLNGGQTGFSF